MKKGENKNKIFGRRKSKNLSNLQKKNLSRYINDFSVFQKNSNENFNFKKLNPNELFDDLNDIRLEIGFGMGDFLFDKALLYPNVGFIGCEVFENGVASLLSKIIEFKINNIRIHFGNCLDLIHNFNYMTLNKIYILFPDPWPKSKHRKRRFFNEINAMFLCSLLKKNGTMNIATDIEDYANQILGIMQKKDNFDYFDSNFFQSTKNVKKKLNTKYEQKALKFGRETNYLIFKKKYE
ncbi:MAG: tRNA (guanosine(46)-N7)-methyltransferase TrmB [Paracoccaceae bacterium]